MCEILFRGQTKRYGEKLLNFAGDKMPSNWVYGGIFPQNNGGDKAIIYQQEPEIAKRVVYADTVGQYIGLTDKNDIKIFDGDACRNGERTYLICWLDNKYAWGCLNLKTYRKTPIYDVISRYGNNFEVIGNKYDISELPQDISEPILKATTSISFQPALKSDDEDFVNFELREG